jgi:hypothetical protein
MNDLNPLQVNENIQLIIEALLFCAVPSINHTLYQDDIEKMINLAVSLRYLNPKVPLVNVFLDKQNFEAKNTLTNFFPELLNN